jgi:hypothetical protein
MAGSWPRCSPQRVALVIGAVSELAARHGNTARGRYWLEVLDLLLQ